MTPERAEVIDHQTGEVLRLDPYLSQWVELLRTHNDRYPPRVTSRRRPAHHFSPEAVEAIVSLAAGADRVEHDAELRLSVMSDAGQLHHLTLMQYLPIAFALGYLEPLPEMINGWPTVRLRMPNPSVDPASSEFLDQLQEVTHGTAAALGHNFGRSWTWRAFATGDLAELGSVEGQAGAITRLLKTDEILRSQVVEGMGWDDPRDDKPARNQEIMNHVELTVKLVKAVNSFSGFDCDLEDFPAYSDLWFEVESAMNLLNTDRDIMSELMGELRAQADRLERVNIDQVRAASKQKQLADGLRSTLKLLRVAVKFRDVYADLGYSKYSRLWAEVESARRLLETDQEAARNVEEDLLDQANQTERASKNLRRIAAVLT